MKLHHVHGEANEGVGHDSVQRMRGVHSSVTKLHLCHGKANGRRGRSGVVSWCKERAGGYVGKGREQLGDSHISPMATRFFQNIKASNFCWHFESTVVLIVAILVGRQNGDKLFVNIYPCLFLLKIFFSYYGEPRW